MARPQQNSKIAPSWSVKITSGEGAGAQAIVEGNRITLGSSEADTIVLPGNVGASRLTLEAQPLGRVKAVANNESVVINTKAILPDISSSISEPLLISLGVLELEVTRTASEGKSQGFLSGGLDRKITRIVVPLLALGLIGTIGYVVWQSVSPNSARGTHQTRTSQSEAPSPGTSTSTASTGSSSGPLAAISTQLATMGLSDAIVVSEAGNTITLSGSVTQSELGAWTDVQPGLESLAAPKALVTNVSAIPAVDDTPVKAARPVRAPSLRGDIAAVDFSRGQVILQSGGNVGLGGDLPDGWRLRGLGNDGIRIEKDGANVTVPLGDLSQ
jgi:hypothetical protein